MNNNTSIALTKQSSQPEIKSYFEGVMHLANSNEQFPVNLDEVWPLVYGRKEEAVRVLKSDFIQEVDFQALRRNAQRGAASPVDYFLSTSCLEYFIARKVRPVFEVYRQVFHKVATPKHLSQSEMLLQSVQMLVENERKVSQLESKVQEIDARTRTRPEYFTVVGYGTLNGYSVNLSMASRIGSSASRKCKLQGIEMDTIPDPRFGQVKMYPKFILDEVFREAVNR
jgi:hypothetical protein